MNTYVKEFLHRGMLFGGFGPVIVGIVYYILSLTLTEFYLTGGEVLLAIVSTYLLAFLQAGASVFHQVEHWSVAKSLFFHFATLYLSYSLCYVVNQWIPFAWEVLLIFTGCFAAGYFLIFFIVVLSIRSVQRRLNRKLQ
ncbi:MAG: DUF3021 domain-containing protein [Clostridia bacterium]|nr:DUF3021 domain-containing protein [Clostridia bacterium]